jgi:hypothetical protein
LEQEDLKIAIAQADTRNRKAHAAHARPNLTPIWGARNLSDWDTNRIGRIAEVAVIRAFALPWDQADVHWRYDNDVYGVEIRGSNLINGCLNVSERDFQKPPDTPFIFCPVNYPDFQPREPWDFTYMVAGWAMLEEMAEARAHQAGDGVLHYKPIRELHPIQNFHRSWFKIPKPVHTETYQETKGFTAPPPVHYADPTDNPMMRLFIEAFAPCKVIVERFKKKE